VFCRSLVGLPKKRAEGSSTQVEQQNALGSAIAIAEKLTRRRGPRCFFSADYLCFLSALKPLRSHSGRKICEIHRFLAKKQMHDETVPGKQGRMSNGFERTASTGVRLPILMGAVRLPGSRSSVAG
jgi:hypothetical protein